MPRYLYQLDYKQFISENTRTMILKSNLSGEKFYFLLKENNYIAEILLSFLKTDDLIKVIESKKKLLTNYSDIREFVSEDDFYGRNLQFILEETQKIDEDYKELYKDILDLINYTVANYDNPKNILIWLLDGINYLRDPEMIANYSDMFKKIYNGTLREQ